MIRLATVEDIPAIKRIADANKQTIGFVNRTALIESIARQQLLVAEHENTIVGFCNYWKRKDGQQTIMEICVATEHRNKGYARMLIDSLARPIRLKCPVDNASNAFYARLGFTLVATLPGKKRQLNLWQLI